ncbi:MAG: hypothetical protein O2909_06955 [Chloroflexi bacterium]|nr:hypothetical protein [Chloroflexota bacterium]
MEGQAVELATVPHAVLRDAPLVDGEWIDSYAVALAEWGARSTQKAYVLEEPDDGHPFAWYRLLDPEGAEVAIEVRQKLWQQTRKHLAGFPGATKELEGRQYFNWAAYFKWRGRRVKGELTSGLRQGLVVGHWNRWVESKGSDGTAILDGVWVGRLDCHSDGYGYQVYPDADQLAEGSRRRENLLASAGSGNTANREDLRLRSKAQQWKEMAEDYLGELYTLRVSFDSINERYFESQSGLFPGSSHALSQLVEQAKNLVNLYNRNLVAGLELLDSAAVGSDAQGPENQHTIDLSILQGRTKGTATGQAAYLVDMAKAEALDAMGETDKAIQLVDLYI